MPNWKKVVVSGSDASLNSLELINATSGSTVLDIQGTQGQLFSITDDLTGDIFSVSDISGVPILNVNADGTTTFDGNVTLTGPETEDTTSDTSIKFLTRDSNGVVKYHTLGSNAFNSTTIPTNNNQLTNGAGFTTNTGTVTSVATGTGLTGGTITSTGTISLSHLGFQNLTDPNDDRIAFWDDSAGAFGWLDAGSNITISGTTISATNTNTTYSAGSLLDLSGTTFNVDLSELTDMTQAWVNSTDEFVVLDSGVQKRKLGSEIFGSNAFNSTTIPTNNNQLTNGAGYTTNVGDITGVTAGVGLSGGGTSGDVTLTLDMSELTDMTAAMVGTDEFIVLDAGADRRKAASEIGLSIFNNDSAFITGVQWDEITGVQEDVDLNGFSNLSGFWNSGDFTSTNITNWNTAYGWGDHSLQGYSTQTLSANSDYGTIITSAEIRLLDDRRRNSPSTDIYTGNTHDYTFYDQDVGIRWYTSGAEDMRLEDDGDLHVDGDVIAFSTTISDKRLKDNVSTIENPLDKIKALRGVEYDWNSGSRKGKRDLGLIAQEVEKVIPNIVHEHELPLLNDDDEDDKTLYKTVDYEKLTAVLIEGMKEQQSQIDELKLEINKLKGDV